MFRDRGVPAAKAAFYRVFIDSGSGPEYLGLYTMIEDPADGSMLDAQFGGRGAIYSPGPAQWSGRGRGVSNKTNEETATSRLRGRHRLAAPRRTPAARNGSLSETRLDPGPFSAWLAVNTVVRNCDAYCVFAHTPSLRYPGSRAPSWIPWTTPRALLGSAGWRWIAFRGGDDIRTPTRGAVALISRLMSDEVYASRIAALSRALEG